MELALWQILILAVAQGFTEFLPISSSGHLVVLSALMTHGDPSKLDVGDVSVVLHLGTLLSILVFYWSRILRLMGEDRRVLRLIVIGSIPVVLVGLPIELFCQHLIENPLLAGLMLPVTGLVLLWATREINGDRQYAELTNGAALRIGCAQAVAILPGISRSGTTIGAGLKLGLKPASAATFSFLLAIPAIGGAGLLKGVKMMMKSELITPWPYLVVGGVVSFAVGLLALKWLIDWLERGRLRLFAWWCIPLGVGVTLWQLIRIFTAT